MEISFGKNDIRFNEAKKTPGPEIQFLYKLQKFNDAETYSRNERNGNMTIIMRNVVQRLKFAFVCKCMAPDLKKIDQTNFLFRVGRSSRRLRCMILDAVPQTINNVHTNFTSNSHRIHDCVCIFI